MISAVSLLQVPIAHLDTSKPILDDSILIDSIHSNYKLQFIVNNKLQSNVTFKQNMLLPKLIPTSFLTSFFDKVPTSFLKNAFASLPVTAGVGLPGRARHTGLA